MFNLENSKREKWDKILKDVEKILDKTDIFDTDEELTYFIFSILEEKYSKGKFEDTKFLNHNRALGLLETLKQEYYRTKIVPYLKKE